jgi:DNA-binding response OmpR family regulator
MITDSDDSNPFHSLLGTELDQIARTASRDRRPLDLSTKEFDVPEARSEASPTPVSAEITRIR